MVYSRVRSIRRARTIRGNTVGLIPSFASPPPGGGVGANIDRRILLTMREFASCARKTGRARVRVNMQYVALVSHACAVTTKGDSPLEEMSI